MATHLRIPGHTPIIVGAVYSRYSVTSYLGYDRYVLKIHNKATGQCKLTTKGGSTIWESESEVSHWYMVDRET
jgi:hypothetical protein